MEKIRFGVVGAGKIGTYHTRTLAKMKEVDLRGVADIDLLRAQVLAWDNNTIAYRDYNDLLHQVDALVIAVPTHLHFEVAYKAMERGIHCLVEKPITDSIEDARKLAELAEKKGVVLQVGHVERFNPAVVEAQKYVKNPLYINMERMGPYDPRVSSIGVTLDLMIHDLDLLLAMVDSPIVSIDAIGASVFSNHEDISNARIRFKNGTVCDVTASRISFERLRRMRVYQDQEYISVDYISSRIKIYRKKTETVTNLNDIEIFVPKIEKKLPITEELYHFIDCIRNSKKPLPDAKKGINALRLAIEITDSLQRYNLPRSFEINEKSKLTRSIQDAAEALKIIVEEKLEEKEFK